MIFEDLELIWREESHSPSHTIDGEVLRQIVEDRARGYRRRILWRDAADIATHLAVVGLLLGVTLRGLPSGASLVSWDTAPMLLCAFGYTFVSFFRYFSRQLQRRREAHFDDSIRGNLEQLVANAEYQIRMQKNYVWWYLLPVMPGFLLIAAGFWSDGPIAFWSMTSLILLIFAVIYWGNHVNLRKELIPQKQELEAMLQGMENGGIPAEIRTSVDPTRSVPLSRRILGFALAGIIFAMVGWILVFLLRPAEAPVIPEFEDVSRFEPGDVARLDTWLAEQVERCDYPSLSVAIVREGTVVYQRAFGFENLWSRRPATTNTLYHVASVTKAFTATLAGRLHEQGVVDLDHPVARYLPADVVISDTPAQGATITLRQLATHSSGLPRVVARDVQSVEWRYALEPARLYELLADVTLEFTPGTGERYSNLGFGLLGHVLELAANRPLNELLQELVCAPLELEHTAYHVDPELPHATGYTTPPRLPERYSYKRRLAGSGGLVTSIGDLAKFLNAHLIPGRFSTNLLAELHTAVMLESGVPAGRALGWSIEGNHPAGRILGKNGGRKNCTAWIGFAPAHRVGVAVVSNIGRPDVDPIGRWLLERSVPGGHRPVTDHGYAKVAPFNDLRWENDVPVVRVGEHWAPLVSIDGIPIERIMQHARKEFEDRARMRFGEDLPEVLGTMGLKPDWELTLGLRGNDGAVRQMRARMTEANRGLIRERRIADE